MEETATTQIETPGSSGNRWWNKINPRDNIKETLILIVVTLLVLGGGSVAWNASRNASKNNLQKQAKETVETKFLAANTVVYGYWSGNSSIIEAADLSTNTNSMLATLPSNIKTVKVLSNNELLFIKDTDDRDYGKSLVLYEISSKKETVVATADEGSGMDDYVVSPNGKYVATWEVSSTTNTLSGGKSRVYSIDRTQQPSRKNVIYDEAATPGKIIHYPIGITNSGDIFLDGFIPNSGSGWAYGMTMSNFTGTTKHDIPGMQNGTYSSQPSMSPDGTKILIIGYDGSRGDGAQNVNGYRRAFLFPNSIEIIDTSTQTRSRILSNKDGLYRSANFDLTDGDIIYTSYNNDATGIERFKYSFRTQASQKLELPESWQGYAKTSLSDGKLLLAQPITSESAIGNLGSKYERPMSGMFVLDPNAKLLEKVDNNGTYVQFIALAGPKYFASSQPGSNLIAQEKNQLQLGSFMVKPSLAPKRIVQQSQPPQDFDPGTIVPSDRGCGSDLLQQQCAGLDVQDGCFLNTWTDGDGTSGSCYRSPLYLYGKEDTSLNVSIGTPIYSANASYSPEKGFDISLLKDGRFKANGSIIDSLTFDYTPSIKKLSRPEYGAVVKNTALAEEIKKYALKIGLNDSETQDILTFAKDNIDSPFVYFSFYDDATSKQILPLYFSLEPDTYRNIVFYFEKFSEKPNLSPKVPTFEPIIRTGFTAIEISHIIK